MPESRLAHSLRDALRGYEPHLVGGDYPDAAVVVALTDSDNPGLVLTQRAPHLSLHPGEIAFPGGKRDVTDPNLLYTAVREMEEEVGVPRDWFKPLAQLHQRVTRTDFRLTPFLGLLPAEVVLDANPDELDVAFEVPLEKLVGGEHFSVVTVHHEGEVRRVARFQIDDYDIWGVTAMIIADVANTLLGGNLPIDTGPGKPGPRKPR